MGKASPGQELPDENGSRRQLVVCTTSTIRILSLNHARLMPSKHSVNSLSTSAVRLCDARESETRTTDTNTHTESNHPIQTHTPPHALAMLGLHKDNAHTLDSSDAQSVEIPGTTIECGSRFLGQARGLTRRWIMRTPSRDSSQDTDVPVRVADALANIKAASLGHACFRERYDGIIQPSTPTQSFGLGHFTSRGHCNSVYFTRDAVYRSAKDGDDKEEERPLSRRRNTYEPTLLMSTVSCAPGECFRLQAQAEQGRMLRTGDPRTTGEIMEPLKNIRRLVYSMKTFFLPLGNDT
ncbi:hypothetical protein EV421DRAFT_1740417 [Armillaria borealis]|uniref:Uncharacterized protein n=1 Tax=Armillaria borealis TaxID=47425 RepID=A0AA39MI40_9AGAR|nr:hypothetical protein EV421DRAFT_1740417 [Armillaria borealis]